MKCGTPSPKLWQCQRSKATGLPITDIFYQAARQYASELSNPHIEQS
jgi:hypothetical protein